MLGYRTGVAAQNRRRMDNGTAAHSRWNDTLEAAGLLFKANVRERLEQPFPWSGECDVICSEPGTPNLYVGELKTMNSRKWRNIPAQLEDRKAMARLLKDYVKGYVYQLTQYIVKLAPLYGTGRVGFFLFENTDTQEYKILFIEPDDTLREEAFEKQLEAQEAAREGTLLEPPFRRQSPTCRKCYKQAVCYLLQDGDVELWQKVTAALEKTKAGQLAPQLEMLTDGFEDWELLDSESPRG